MVGFIGIKNYEKEIYLYRFFIDEKYRNNGIVRSNWRKYC